MVKKFLIRLLYNYGSKVVNSVFKAYKDTVKNAPKGGANQNKQQDQQQEQKGPFGKFSFNNLISTPMTKEEALKILNIKDSEATPEKIIEQFEKYFESNDPMKGGSFYIQNKVYYAKEFLMEKYPKELNKSKYNPDTYYPGEKTAESKKEEDPVEKNKNKNI
jgi:hypothetical protein